MNHHKDQFAAGGLFAEQAHDQLGIGRREAGGGFIHEEHRGFANEFQGNVQALALTAADRFLKRRADAEAGGIRLAKIGQQGLYPLLSKIIRKMRHAEARGIIQVLKNGQILEKQIVLRHESDHALDGVRLSMDVMSVQQEAPGIGADGSVQNAHQCGFSCAAGTHNADEATAAFIKGKIMQSIVASRKAEVEVFAAERDDGLFLSLRLKGGRNAGDVPFVALHIPQNLSRFQQYAFARNKRAALQPNGFSADRSAQQKAVFRKTQHGEPPAEWMILSGVGHSVIAGNSAAFFGGVDEGRQCGDAFRGEAQSSGQGEGDSAGEFVRYGGCREFEKTQSCGLPFKAVQQRFQPLGQFFGLLEQMGVGLGFVQVG